MGEKNNELPLNWLESSIDDIIVRITNGCSNQQTEIGKGLPITRIETISFENIDWSKVKYILDYDDKLIEKYKLQEGDILFSHINSDLHLGKTAVFKDKNKLLIHGINLLLIRPSALIVNSSFLNFYFNLARYRGIFIDMAQRAVNQSSINQKKLKSLLVPLPPLNEQKRIVNKIEELLSELDHAVESFKKIQQQLKIYRQAVLKAAFEGKLTQNYNDRLRLGLAEISSAWKCVDLEVLIEGTPQNGLYKPANFYGEGDYIIRIDNFYEGVLQSHDKFKKIQLSEHELKKYKVEIGDILINRVNSMSHLGKCGLVKQIPQNTIFESNIMRIKVNMNLVCREYLAHYLSSQNGLIELRKNAKQAVNQASINQTDVQKTRIPICSLEEQNQIVQEIESRLSICDELEKTIKQNLILEKSLRQSILKKAFEGKLVPQDPNDEPAELLLEKIKLEKEKLARLTNSSKTKTKREKVTA